MKKITSFNPQNLDELKRAINKALEPIAKEFGLGKLEACAGSYLSSEWTGKIKATLTADLIAADPHVKSLNEQYIRMFDLPENVMDMEFTMQGKTFSITGFNPRKPKNAISLTGNMMCPVETIKNLITLKKYALKTTASASN